MALCFWKEGRVPLEQALGDREEPLFIQVFHAKTSLRQRVNAGYCMRFGLCLEFLVEVLRIDVQLLLGRLLRPGGGLGDLACQAGFDEPDSFCLNCSPAQRVTIPYSHVATGYGHIHVWSADQQNLHSISVAEDAAESYIPSGIDVGIDFGKVETPCTPAKVMAAPLRELEGLQHRLGVGRASCSAPTTGNQ